MSKKCLRLLPLIFTLTLFRPVLSQEYGHLPVDEYAKRRAAVLEAMPAHSVAVFQAAPVKTRSNDISYEYRQNSNFLYLTGVTAPNTALVLIKRAEASDSTTADEILFVPQEERRNANFLSPAITAEQAKNLLGFTKVDTYDRFQQRLSGILSDSKWLFTNFQPDFVYEPVSQRRYVIGRDAKKALRKRYPDLKIKSPNRILAQLRQIKSAAELALMQKAVDLTCEAQVEAMRSAEPGMYEYEVEAIIEFVFKRGGAQYPAFPSIVGSGPNSTILHHWRNDRQMQDGDVLVMDIGAEYFGYAADVTRTIPVSGTFTPEQREIYEIVLRAQKKAIAGVRPGVSFREIHKIAKEVIEEAGYGKYFTHATSHYVGLDVHDVGGPGTLRPGMVITVEPGIYLPEGAEVDKKYWNIGIRIEDDVLVTEQGHRVLSKKAPKEISEIERLMRQEGHLSWEEK